jgi:hypothetical protein
MFYMSADAMRLTLRVLASKPSAIENGTADFYRDRIPEVGPGFELTIGAATFKVLG